MWRFRFYSQWNYEKVEAWLGQMEENGWRLAEVRANYFFRFQKAAPSNAKYIFTYTFLKEYGMIDCEQQLKREFSANAVAGRFCAASVYRICKGERDLSGVITFRRNYLKHVLRKKLLLVSLFSALFLLYVVCAAGRTLSAFYLGCDILFRLLLILCVSLALYYVTGLVMLGKNAG